MKSGISVLLFGFYVFLGFAPIAAAGPHFEPYVGYATGEVSVNSANIDHKGTLYGARLGYAMPMFTFGVEYMGGSFKDEDTSASGENTWKSSNLGLYASVEFPVLVRVFAAYFIKAEVEGSDSSGSNDFEGTATKFGIGLTPLPLLSVNFEIYNSTYDEMDGQSLSSDLKIDAMALTVSLPLP